MSMPDATKGGPIIAPQGSQEEELDASTPEGSQEFQVRDLAWFGKADVYRRNRAKRTVAGELHQREHQPKRRAHLAVSAVLSPRLP